MPGAGLAEVPADVDDRRAARRLAATRRGARPRAAASDRHPSARGYRAGRWTALRGASRNPRRRARVSPPCHDLPTRLAIGLLPARPRRDRSRALLRQPPAPSLADRDFLSVAVTDGGAAQAARRRDARSASTSGATDLGASAGCNSIGGTYRIDGGRLVFEGGGMTEMGCDAERHAQDDWLVAVPRLEAAVRLAGNELTLDSGATVVRLARSRGRRAGPRPRRADLDRRLDHRRRRRLERPRGRASRRSSSRPTARSTSTPAATRAAATWNAVGHGHRDLGRRPDEEACAGAGGQLESAVVRVLGAGHGRGGDRQPTA